MAPPVDHPVDQVQALVAEARYRLARDVDEFLRVLAQYGPPNQILQALRDFMLEKFDQVLPLRSTADPVLVQLVREAYRVLNEPGTGINLQDWNREAERILGPIPPLNDPGGA